MVTDVYNMSPYEAVCLNIICCALTSLPCTPHWLASLHQFPSDDSAPASYVLNFTCRDMNKRSTVERYLHSSRATAKPQCSSQMRLYVTFSSVKPHVFNWWSHHYWRQKGHLRKQTNTRINVKYLYYHIFYLLRSQLLAHISTVRLWSKMQLLKKHNF